MAGALRMDYRPYTYRQLFVMYESFMLTSWDHTAALISHLSCITTSIIKANSKKGNKAKPIDLIDAHPFRFKTRPTGHTIRPENIRDLKAIFG